MTTRTWSCDDAHDSGHVPVPSLPRTTAPVRAATSPIVTVSGTNPNPPLLSVSARVPPAPGAPVTVTLDRWDDLGRKCGLAGTFAELFSRYAASLQYVYVGAGVTTRTWTVNMPTTSGTYEFRLFPNNSFTKIAASPPVTVGSQ